MEDDTQRAEAGLPPGEVSLKQQVSLKQPDYNVGECGIMGAIGGAVVGMLAGGPIGAVIGGALGGAASATTVEGLNHHDRGPSASVSDSTENDKTKDDKVETVAPVSEQSHICGRQIQAGLHAYERD